MFSGVISNQSSFFLRSFLRFGAAGIVTKKRSVANLAGSAILTCLVSWCDPAYKLLVAEKKSYEDVLQIKRMV